MTPELWQRLKPLYDAALEIPETERAKFVAKACGNDSELRKELAALLKASGEPTWISDAPIVSFRDLFPPESKPFWIGELVLGRFEIIRHLGTGGMGEVYEAMDRELGRIALKTIRPDVAGNPDTLARFRKEVQLARKISGPHVCRIHELFVIPASTREPQKVFLTMEFLDGMTLADKIGEDGPHPWQEARLIALQICDGLHTIHEAGIIHRDLKSRNIMLASRNGSTCTVLMDFGLAHEFSKPTSATLSGSTASGIIAGTPDYMAPEQFAGKELTPATDVYALGIVLYEVVTGKHPFIARTPLEAAVQRGERLCLASSIQPGLPRLCDEVICRCLEYDPKRRYQSAKEIEEALQHRAYLLGLKQKWFELVVGIIGAVLILSSLLLIPAIGERVRGILLSSHEKHIAVLPFDFVGSNPETEALGDGLMDSLAGELSNLDAANQTLWVVPPTEIRSRKVNNPSSALREFGVTIVVKGSFERNNQNMRLRLTLIDTKKIREIGFVDVENQAGDLAALQDEAVTRLGRLMNVSVNANTPGSPGKPIRPAAYEDYLTGLGYMQRYDQPGKLESAITLLRNSVNTDPQFALGFAQLGEAYRLKYQLDQDRQWLDQSQIYCRRALELDKHISAAYVTLARIHEDTGRPDLRDLAATEFQRALNVDPRDANALNGLAHLYEHTGRPADAETTFQKAVALRPDYWDSYDELGNFYDRQRKFQKAVAQYKHAIELTPDNAQVYANLGKSYLDSGDSKLLPDAEKAFEKSIALGPTYSALANLGVLYLSQNRYAAFATVTERALQLDDHNWMVWDNLVMAYEWLKEIDRANVARETLLEHLEQTLEIKPQDADARSTLAILYAHGRSEEKALSQIQASLALAPDDPDVLSNVADAYELLGERKKAVDYLNKAFHKGLTKSAVEQDPYLQQLIADPTFRFPPKHSHRFTSLEKSKN